MAPSPATRSSTTKTTSHRLQAVQTPIIPVVGRLIQDHPGTISLGQGVVHYGPPPEALERIGHFLARPDSHKYQPVHGLPELIRRIEAKLAAENRIGLEPDSGVVVTAGANMGFMNAILAVTDPGDEVILQRPFYFNHEMAVLMADARPVIVDTDADYQLQPEAIRAALTPRTRAVVTISPNNPTGTVYAESALREVNAICAERGLYHISDEAYEYFTYDGAEHFSPGSINGAGRHTISLFSLSKAYGFASWRIGYMVIPRDLFVSVQKIQDTILICPPGIAQEAACGALDAGRAYCREKLGALAQVRRLVLEELAACRSFCTVPAARGAFYVLLRLDTDMDDMALVERLVREHRVAVIPGQTFGMTDGCYLRVAYGALERQTVAEGLGRLTRGLHALLAR